MADAPCSPTTAVVMERSYHGGRGRMDLCSRRDAEERRSEKKEAQEKRRSRTQIVMQKNRENNCGAISGKAAEPFAGTTRWARPLNVARGASAGLRGEHFAPPAPPLDSLQTQHGRRVDRRLRSSVGPAAVLVRGACSLRLPVTVATRHPRRDRGHTDRPCAEGREPRG